MWFLALLLLIAALPQKPAPFVNTLSMAEMSNKQAVVNTTEGMFVIDLKPELAPNHVGYFIKLAREGAFDGTTFHRLVRHGIIQGGDPLTKDPAKAKQYGTGGLGVLKAEFSSEPATRGAVAAILQPGKADSAGSQFFVCVTDQPALTGKYTIFGRVSEGMDVVTKISEAPASPEGVPLERIEVVSVTIRDTPPPEPEPFSAESVEELAAHRAVLETSAGPITVEFFPHEAPEHVRNFLRLAEAGVFDGMSFHRVVRGFAVQTGSLGTRGPLSEKQQKLVRSMPPEFNDTKHVKGILAMARGDDPASATTSFFIVTADAPSLDGKYTAFGRVIEGMAAVEAIEAAPVNGEEPTTRIELKSVRVLKSEAAMRFDTGEVAWRDRSVGKGSLIYADRRLYLFSEPGVVGLAEPNPDGYREHGRFEIDSGTLPAWSHPVVANGRLYLREQDNIYAYDARAR